ncbi:MAG TPA: hypothetical protein VFO97_06505 [Desertimonas sp.]|nr:hypothetical protein [Desertimonas sp.]
MRTRTLLLLAVACGLVILVAGVLQLLRISDQRDAEDVPVYGLGDDVEVGDMAVVVDGYDEAAGTAIVDVTLGGVDDLDGASEFRLVVLGESVESTGAGDDACRATTIEPQACRLTFVVDDPPGAGRILLYRRGEDVARWRLAAAGGS